MTPQEMFDKAYLGVIQQAHDAADPGNFVEDFKRNMACVAPAFRLTIPQLEQHQ